MAKMQRTTIYLPDMMKEAIEREAGRLGVTEAEIIRGAVSQHLEAAGTPVPDLPLFPEGFGVNIAGRVDELLQGMGGNQ